MGWDDLEIPDLVCSKVELDDFGTLEGNTNFQLDDLDFPYFDCRELLSCHQPC